MSRKPNVRMIVRLDVSEQDYCLLQEASKRSGMSTIEWLRRVALVAARDVVCGGVVTP